jgi:hypothetical protein
MMSSRAKTQHSKYVFKVKEGAGDVVFIIVEPLSSEIPIFRHALLGFDLHSQTTLKQAEMVAEYLNEHIAGIGITLFDAHPLFASSRSSHS